MPKTLSHLLLLLAILGLLRPVLAEPPSNREVALAVLGGGPSEQLSVVAGSPIYLGDFHGLVQHDFKLDGVACKVVAPRSPAKGNPWIWRARFWGHQPQLDLALLNQGWHVAYCEVGNLFGNKQAVARWDRFYMLTQEIGLHPQPILEGMSRGGLIVMRWASANPTKVGGIYVDNAVMDMRSWPGGKGTGKGSLGAWKQCLAAYHLTEPESLNLSDGPLDRLEGLAKNAVPIFAMINEADDVVPPAENGDLLVKRYREMGGTITEKRRAGLGHHPHSLTDPAVLVKFATNAVAGQFASQP